MKIFSSWIFIIFTIITFIIARVTMFDLTQWFMIVLAFGIILITITYFLYKFKED